MEKLQMQTKDIASENFQKLAAMFPNAVTETIIGYDEEGKAIIERAIDADVLRQEISGQVVEGKDERYRFTWPDKKKAVVLANQVFRGTLRPCREKSVNFDNTENVYIEGDNLEALKLIQETYLEKIKVIYIDPPYNTGSDFVYDDDFSENVEEFVERSGQIDDAGNRLVVNLDSNGRFHTNWLNMIYPRLRIARNLLSDDGVMFISIDENEIENCKKVCEEIFGEQNFVDSVIWERAFSPKNDAKYLSESHDYILIFAKNINSFSVGLLPRTEEANARYKNPDNDEKGPWTSSDMTVKTYSAAYDYEITTPGGNVVKPTNGRCWFTSKDRMQKLIDEGRVYFGEDGNNTPRLKRYLSDVQQGMTATTIWKCADVGHNQEGRQELKKLFDGKGYFDGPKPQRLLDRILTIANLNNDSIVLDFFSGAASTAQAVFQHNVDNNKKCKFIMIQLQEQTVEESDARKDGFTSICDIGEERIRRAGKMIHDEKEVDFDYGFRVFRIDSSNMKDVFYNPAETQQTLLDMFSDNIKPDRTPEDLLFQIMLDLGVMLSSKIEETEIAGKKVFDVAEGFLIACFDRDITDETVKAIAQKKPYYAVFRDSSMASDSVATNFDQIFETYSPETERRVL